jgi:DNA-binding XRE family transcriptional regulator
LKTKEVLKMLMRGMTQAEFLRKIDVPKSTAINWYKGRIMGYQQVINIKEKLQLGPMDFALLLSAVQTDLIDNWRKK